MTPKPVDRAEVTYHLLPIREPGKADPVKDPKDPKPKKNPKPPKGRQGGDDREVKVAKIDIPSNCSAKNDANQNICFAYNRKSCAVRGAKCRRGLHVCWKKGCFGKRPYPDCGKQKDDE